MMKTILAALALLLLAALSLGCDTKNGSALAPQSHWIQTAQALPDLTFIGTNTKGEIYERPDGIRVVLGLGYKIVLVCDYPCDSYGPLPPGHGTVCDGLVYPDDYV